MKPVASKLNSDRRRGVTLTEVLMSLMIMSIGVVSLATLFPIASLRVLEATNLTNSTIVSFNAESIVDSFPRMVNDANGNGSTQEELGRNYIVDPLGWHEHVDQLGITSITDPTLLYFEYNRPTSINLPVLTPARPTRFLGDMFEDLNNNGTLDGGEDSNGNGVLDFPSFFTSIDVTRQIVSLPDTTTDIVDTFPDVDGTNNTAYATNAAGQITGLILPTDVDLSIVALEPSLYQVLILDQTGKYSETRTLRNVTGQQIDWRLDLNNDGDFVDPGESEYALPRRFGVNPDTAAGTRNVGLIRIEQPVPYYSWLLTVHKDFNGPVNVDVVVFNKREFSQLSEQVYLGDLVRHTVGPDGVPGTTNGGPNADGDDNANGTIDDASELGYPGSDDVVNDLVTINWDPTLYPGGTASPVPPPPIRRGAYIYDSLNGYWYRIRQIESSSSSTSATVALESAIRRNNTEDVSLDGTLGDLPGEDLDNDGIIDRGGVIVPRGVIAVFPLKTK